MARDVRTGRVERAVSGGARRAPRVRDLPIAEDGPIGPCVVRMSCIRTSRPPSPSASVRAQSPIRCERSPSLRYVYRRLRDVITSDVRGHPGLMVLPGGRATALGRAFSRFWAAWAALGLPPRRQVALEVKGRRTGRPHRLAVVVARHEGQEYLVSMVGDGEWVKNVRAARCETEVFLDDRRASDACPSLTPWSRPPRPQCILTKGVKIWVVCYPCKQ
jgi:hypothetical protein